jgi:hypothetical protein
MTWPLAWEELGVSSVDFVECGARKKARSCSTPPASQLTALCETCDLTTEASKHCTCWRVFSHLSTFVCDDGVPEARLVDMSWSGPLPLSRDCGHRHGGSDGQVRGCCSPG